MNIMSIPVKVNSVTNRQNPILYVKSIYNEIEWRDYISFCFRFAQSFIHMKYICSWFHVNKNRNLRKVHQHCVLLIKSMSLVQCVQCVKQSSINIEWLRERQRASVFLHNHINSYVRYQTNKEQKGPKPGTHNSSFVSQ